MHVENDFDIKNLTSFKIGGKIKEMYFPKTENEFENILSTSPNAIIVGNLSNTLVSSFGYNGVVISTSKLDNISFNGNIVKAGGGVKGPKLSQKALENSLSGLEFMIGFPGSVGGEVFMNAGAHGSCIADVFKSAKVFHNGKIIEVSKDEMEFSYRNSICEKANFIILEAEFELTEKPYDMIKSKMDENLNFRKAHQPSLVLPNCGSVFKNPPEDSAGRLIEQAGAKGLKFGGAEGWQNHANFIINQNCATSLDILNLMNEIQTKVEEKFNIKLMPEIKYLGDNEDEVKLWYKLTQK